MSLLLRIQPCLLPIPLISLSSRCLVLIVFPISVIAGLEHANRVVQSHTCRTGISSAQDRFCSQNRSKAHSTNVSVLSVDIPASNVVLPPNSSYHSTPFANSTRIVHSNRKRLHIVHAITRRSLAPSPRYNQLADFATLGSNAKRRRCQYAFGCVLMATYGDSPRSRPSLCRIHKVRCL